MQKNKQVRFSYFVVHAFFMLGRLEYEGRTHVLCFPLASRVLRGHLGGILARENERMEIESRDILELFHYPGFAAWMTR